MMSVSRLRSNVVILCSTTYRSFATAPKISTVAVIGGGFMGSGIAQVAAQAGYNVAVVDQTKAWLKASEESIEKGLRLIAAKNCPGDKTTTKKFIQDTFSRVKFFEGLADAKNILAAADLVIEAIVEKLEAKQPLFEELDKCVKEECVLASNTSSLPISDIIKRIPHRNDRCGGLHFFVPVPLAPLVEVVSLSETSLSTKAILNEFCKAIGKTTIQCKDTPGFVVNRLLVPYVLQAVLMVERGDASMKDIDTAMKLGAGYAIGPFELLDMVGLDVAKFITDGWAVRFKDDAALSVKSKLLDQLVAENKLGRKTGEGFYKYKPHRTPRK